MQNFRFSLNGMLSVVSGLLLGYGAGMTWASTLVLFIALFALGVLGGGLFPRNAGYFYLCTIDQLFSAIPRVSLLHASAPPTADSVLPTACHPLFS